jgi:calcineurin-like phosphoesterase family protein
VPFQKPATRSSLNDEEPTAQGWFTADTHFGHGGAIGRFKRPFKSAAEMDEAMIAGWNEVVGRDDQVWHLGDFAYRAARARVSDLLQRLNGRKHLIIGNNDGEPTLAADEWESIGRYAELTLGGVRLVLCHYPFRTWDRMYKGAYNLHGHSHGKLKPLRHQVDVGVDVWNFRPIGIETIVRSKRRSA